MCAKARLAASEFDKNTNISVRESISFHGSTLHGHDFYEIEIIKSGSTLSKLNGKDAVAESGTVFFMTPADFHEYEFCQGFDLYNIQFTAEAISSKILERLVSEKARSYQPNEKIFGKMCKLSSVMLELFTEGANPEILTRLLESLLLLLINDSRADIYSVSESGQNIQKSITYIHEHFKENPSLGEVAATLPLNEKYFCLKFREYTGMTYKEYLKALKLRFARRLVLATSLSMAEIAENSGYGTQSHFNREFKEYYGISPLKLRFDKK